MGGGGHSVTILQLQDFVDQAMKKCQSFGSLVNRKKERISVIQPRMSIAHFKALRYVHAILAPRNGNRIGRAGLFCALAEPNKTKRSILHRSRLGFAANRIETHVTAGRRPWRYRHSGRCHSDGKKCHL